MRAPDQQLVENYARLDLEAKRLAKAEQTARAAVFAAERAHRDIQTAWGKAYEALRDDITAALIEEIAGEAGAEAGAEAVRRFPKTLEALADS